MTETKPVTRLKRLYNYLVENEVGIEPLVTFRISFSILMLISLIRFWYMGWIEELYLLPTFFFKYYGFHWVPAPNETSIYVVFVLLIIACLGIGLGLLYRLSIISFFVLFTYIELIDATNYLNHYYFISLIAFLLIFLPANKYFALDTRLFKDKRLKVKAWHINIIKLQIGILYFFAGVAKLNADWLVEAKPLSIWLPAKVHLPIIGELLTYRATAYFFSWAGVIFDLSIFFLLIYKRTRIFAYLGVIAFHLLTWSLFPIGMFPFVMIFSNLIFFSTKTHQRLYAFFRDKNQHDDAFVWPRVNTVTKGLLTIYITIQLALSFRYLFYPGDLFWTEQGYRFSWRVMLIEKGGYATFTVKDNTGKKVIVDNKEYLTPFQEKMMSTQPDFILQYAKHLKTIYEKKGFESPSVYGDVFVSLNGEGSKRFIDPTIDLSAQNDNFAHKSFILLEP